MDRKKIFWAIITILISAVVLIVIIDVIFDMNSVNEGKLRMADAILSSTAVLEKVEPFEENTSWTFNVSQNNKLSLLVNNHGEAKIKEIYLDNVRTNVNNDNIYICQEKYSSKHNISSENKKVNIYSEEREDGTKVIEFDIVNKDILKNYTFPKKAKEVRYDGTVFGIANTKISDINFKFKAELVIKEEDGTKNICKISMKMPKEELVTTGQIVERLSLTQFNFKVSM